VPPSRGAATPRAPPEDHGEEEGEFNIKESQTRALLRDEFLINMQKFTGKTGSF